MKLTKAAQLLTLFFYTTTYAFHVPPPQGTPSTRLFVRPTIVGAYQKKYVYTPEDAAATSNLMDKVVPASVPDVDVDVSLSTVVVEKKEEVVQSVTQAADAAAEAAKAAADAAAAISAPAMKASVVKATATKAAVATTAKGKVAVPTLAEFILHPKSATEIPANTGPNVMEKLELLKNNLFGNVKLPDSNVVPIAKTAVAGAATATGSSAWEAFVTNLKLNEFGAWYVAGFAAFAALTQRQAGKEAAEAEFEEQLNDAKEKALIAASAADKAALEAAKAKQLASTGITSTTSNFRENLAKSLTESKQQLLAIDEEMTKAQLIALKDEVSKLKKQLKSVEQDRRDLSDALKLKEAVVEKAEEVVANTVTIATKTTKTTATKTKKASTAKKTTTTEKKETDTKVKAETKAKAKKEADAKAKAEAKAKKDAEMKAKKEADAKAKAEAKAKKDAEMKAKKEADAKAKAEEKAKKDAEIKAKEEASAKKAEAKAQAAAEAKAKAEADAKAKSAAEEARLAAKRMEADAKIAEEARRAVEIEEQARKKNNQQTNGTVDNKHPWALLSPSAFKRLAANDLIEFLDERGANYKDDSGKNMLKKDLLKAVEQLL